MTNDDIKEFALELARADTENEVIDILKQTEYWDMDDSWREYGDNPQNLSIIGNQQSRGDSALVEKLINSVDAVLMKECLRKGINPNSEQAPQSIVEAQKQFFGIYNGKLSSLDSAERKKIADNIWLIATGTKSNPSFSIIDKGEGQSPEQMPKTILSLTKSNKNTIGFVQGKYGMGGSGVLPFCGCENNVLFIISKRSHEIDAEVDKEIYGEDETRNLWGVTVVRREDPKGQEKNSHYTYLAPQGKILSFRADELLLLPRSGTHPKIFDSRLNSGTFIKLYEYDIGTGLKSAIYFNLYYRLALLIPDVALPITMLEGRGYQADSDSITLAGLSVRLEDDPKQNLEPGFPSTGSMTIDGEKLDYSIYAFKKNEESKKSKKESYAKEGVIFSINGQAHGFLSADFFSRRNVGMNYISDSILVTVDSSKMTRRKQEELFMASRDRLANKPIRRLIEEELEKIIGKHAGLKALRNKRREEMTKNALEEEKPLKDIFSKLIKNSPNLAKVLSSGFKISNPFDFRSVAASETEFTGEKFPSYFKLSKNCDEKPHPINQESFRVQYETDVENNYFQRDEDPGKMTLKCTLMRNNEVVNVNHNISLWNGSATLTVNISNIKKNQNLAPEDILHFEATVDDVNQIEPFTSEFSICIKQEKEANGSNSGTRKNPPGDKPGKERQKPSLLDPPPEPIPVHEDEWEKHDFDKYSALRIMDSGEKKGYDFYVNVDNIYLQSEIKNSKIAPEILKNRYTMGMVLLGMSIIYYDKDQEKNADKNSNGSDVYSQISQFSAAMAPFLLPMISLADLGRDSES